MCGVLQARERVVRDQDREILVVKAVRRRWWCTVNHLLCHPCSHCQYYAQICSDPFFFKNHSYMSLPGFDVLAFETHP